MRLLELRGCPTITSNNQELVVLADIVYLDVGEGSDYLLLGRKIGALLELEIADGARQGKVTVDTAKVDEAASSLDARLLGWKFSVYVTARDGLSYLRSEACDRMKGALPCP